MIAVRGWLHIGALVIPLVAGVAWTLLLFRDDLAGGLLKSLYFAVPAIVAAQAIALLRWRALERRATAGEGGWKTGLGMAALTHALFGVLLAVALALAVGLSKWWVDSGVWNLIGQAAFFAVASIGAAGVITFPGTALLAQRIASLRQRELAR